MREAERARREKRMKGARIRIPGLGMVELGVMDEEKMESGETADDDGMDEDDGEEIAREAEEKFEEEEDEYDDEEGALAVQQRKLELEERAEEDRDFPDE